MKSKFKLLVVLFSLAFFTAEAGNAEKQKEFHKAWPVGEISKLQVINKFGEVKITDEGGPDITIDVVVTVEAMSENKAEELLRQIDVAFSKSGSTAIAETSIEDNFSGRQQFSIDYSINIPPDKSLDISNKYGNVVINELNAPGNFVVGYGNLTAQSLESKNAAGLNIVISYGKADIEAIADATVDIKYSKFTASEAGSIKLLSKYSVFTADEIKSLDADSKYDTFNLEEAGSVTAISKYSHFNIEELKKALKIESGYGGIKVEEVSSGFESIVVESSYGSISLGIGGEVSYTVSASCDYCGISYDEDRFKGNRESEDNSKQIEGKIGSGNPTAKVIVRSRYGSIKLAE